MAKEWAKKFYNSKAWQDCRASYIATVYGLCEHCGKPGYIVDHIEELTPTNINNPELTLNFNNLQYLCQECHNRKTFEKFSATKSNLFFDEDGQISPR